jgi:hypothetical protein
VQQRFMAKLMTVCDTLAERGVAEARRYYARRPATPPRAAAVAARAAAGSSVAGRPAAAGEASASQRGDDDVYVDYHRRCLSPTSLQRERALQSRGVPREPQRSRSAGAPRTMPAASSTTGGRGETVAGASQHRSEGGAVRTQGGAAVDGHATTAGSGGGSSSDAPGRAAARFTTLLHRRRNAATAVQPMGRSSERGLMPAPRSRSVGLPARGATRPAARSVQPPPPPAQPPQPPTTTAATTATMTTQMATATVAVTAPTSSALAPSATRSSALHASADAPAEAGAIVGAVSRVTVDAARRDASTTDVDVAFRSAADVEWARQPQHGTAPLPRATDAVQRRGTVVGGQVAQQTTDHACGRCHCTCDPSTSLAQCEDTDDDDSLLSDGESASSLAREAEGARCNGAVVVPLLLIPLYVPTALQRWTTPHPRWHSNLKTTRSLAAVSSRI